MASILQYPLLAKNTLNKQAKEMKRLTQNEDYSMKHGAVIVSVDTIRQNYLTAMGIDSSLAKTSQQSDQRG